MRRDPTYWHEAADRILRVAVMAVAQRDGNTSDDRYYDLIDAHKIAIRIRDHMERKHAS